MGEKGCVWNLVEKKDKEVLGRIKRLEQEVSELSTITKEVKETLNKLVCNEASPTLLKEVRGVPYTSDANPWALEASKSIMETRKMRDFINSSRVDTYKTTLKVLKSKTKWLSADDIGKLSGRKRNTESTYLNRLFRAGVVDQKTEKNKTLYKIKDYQTVVRLFGEI
jgi:leucyl aminopeptidase (aminopeptidase T)